MHIYVLNVSRGLSCVVASVVSWLLLLLEEELQVLPVGQKSQGLLGLRSLCLTDEVVSATKVKLSVLLGEKEKSSRFEQQEIREKDALLQMNG